MSLNGDADLEREPDVMRTRVLQMTRTAQATANPANQKNRFAARGGRSTAVQIKSWIAESSGKRGRSIAGLSASGFLALQTLTGNRAVARTLAGLAVQRRSAQELIDKRVALSAAVPQVVDDELVPIGEAPGRFDGFATKDAAIALARRSPEVAIVVRDPDRYHVLRTTATTLGSKAAAPENPKGWIIVEIVEPAKRSGADTFELDYQAARNTSGDTRPTAYRRLLVSGTHLELSDTAWASSEADATPGKVNVALWLPSRGRHLPAKVVPTGTTELPRTTILIGTSPFAEGAVSLRATLLHESRHAYHMAETLKLVRQWRETRKSDTPPAWDAWLKSQRKVVPPEVFQTVWANTHAEYGTATTETYSHLYGFMYRFRRDGDAHKDPSALDAAATTALHVRMAGLGTLGEHWEAAAQDARDSTMDQLAAFAAELTANQRHHLRNFITKAGAARDAPKVFYRELAKRL